MRLDGKSKGLLGIFAICAVLTVCGSLYLDTRIARYISEEFGKGFPSSTSLSNLPDFLFPFVCVMTFVSWAARLLLLRKPARQRYAEFLEYVGSGLPVAFIVKAVLKDVFGRMNTRIWLLHPHMLKFHWFGGGGNYSGFPSGHMVIFTVLALGISRYFPRLRLVCAGLLLALALALMVTQYHFLSDIAAGVIVGMLVDLFVRWALSFAHRQRRSGSM